MVVYGYNMAAMPSPNRRSPRIQVTLSPRAMELLDMVSAATGQGRATVASELIDLQLPMIEANIEALRLVKESPREAQRLLARTSAEAVMKLQQVQLELDDLLSEKPRPKRQRRKRRDPDGAT